MNTILLAEGKLTPSCSKCHITYAFELNNDSSRLDIYFSYEPKVLDNIQKSKELICQGIVKFCEGKHEELEQWEKYLPIKNLLTISIDDRDTFRGCAHNQLEHQHLFITKNNASNGLIPGNIAVGQWKVTISVHAAVTEICNYKLHITEGE